MTINLLVDGSAVTCQEGETILTVARRLGRTIPTLCHVEGLKPEGGCRLCQVLVNGRMRAACHTLVEEGSQIVTDHPDIRSERKNLLGLYQSAYPHAFSNPSSPLGRLAQTYGLKALLAPERPKSAHPDHPYLRFDRSLCVNCRRCVQVCRSVQGQFVFAMGERGGFSRLMIGLDDTFSHSPCVACGRCVDECPTFALTDRDHYADRSAVKAVQSVCGYCGVGCRIEASLDASDQLAIKGVRDAAVNRGHLCAKGRFAHHYTRHPERLTQPQLRKANGFEPITWTQAYEWLVDRIQSTQKKYGPDAFGLLTSSRSTNEAGYVSQKLFRSIIGTNNVDCCARVCHASTAQALQKVTGTGAASASYADIEKARCIFVVGANPTEAHPVVGARIKQAALAGTPLVVIDPRAIELTQFAQLHLALKPGSNVALFHAIAKVMLAQNWLNSTYVQERLEGFETYQKYLESVSMRDLAASCAVPESAIHQAAEILGRGPTLFVHGLGLSELTQGVDSVATLCNLAMLNGSIGQPGAGMLPLRGQNNVQGNADIGSMPNLFTGYQSLSDPTVRTRLQEIWGWVPPATPGKTMPEMFESAAQGTLKFLWLQGEDSVQSDPNTHHIRQALGNLETLVIQDLFFSETAEYAHLILPAAGALEQDGTFTNGERRIQRVRPILPPPGESRPDWLVMCQLAKAMGVDWALDEPSQVMEEIARVAPHLFGGVTYEKLEGDGIQWPCPAHSEGTTTVHAKGFIRGRGLLTATPYHPSPETCTPEFPFILNTGRVLHHYNVGSMTRRSDQSILVAADYLEMNPEDAKQLALEEGQTVEIRSRYGSAQLVLKKSERVQPGTLFSSFHFPQTRMNQVTSCHVDPESKCPEYKITAVSVRGLSSEAKG
ncbi:MAG: formate dehydrogenase subunit alpha [Acidobacteria bacterium]|nr:formate dehydrogenase subunit alpha [Acidobacteriota bacterium]MCB9398389.1 formate dehydrogenase subunit alpha [Acidobacteriota bacterium]